MFELISRDALSYGHFWRLREEIINKQKTRGRTDVRLSKTILHELTIQESENRVVSIGPLTPSQQPQRPTSPHTSRPHPHPHPPLPHHRQRSPQRSHQRPPPSACPRTPLPFCRARVSHSSRATESTRALTPRWPARWHTTGTLVDHARTEVAR